MKWRVAGLTQTGLARFFMGARRLGPDLAVPPLARPEP
jgi:hypothetical protein